MRSQYVIRFGLILFVIGIFVAVSAHAQTSTQTNTDTSITDSTQTTTQTTTTSTCNVPCSTPAALPRTGNSGTSGEIYFNAGGIWPMRMSSFNEDKFKSEGVYGVKGALTFGSGAGVEAGLGYLNHFETKYGPNFYGRTPALGTPGAPTIYAFMYDIDAAWNFGNRRVFGAKVEPYIVAGPGGLTAEVRHNSAAFIQGGGLVVGPRGTLVANPGPTKVIHDGDTFLTFNYGGGIKAMNLWGPVGLRADIRGRTIANFYHSSPTWPEATGGLLISWGEK